MKDTCIVLGAGFSKAISDLPVTKDMINAFNEELEIQRSLKKSNQIKEGEEIIKFITDIQNYFLKSFYPKSDDFNIIQPNYSENFEALCSFIDLNSTSEINEIIKLDGTIDDVAKIPLFANCTTSKLEKIRKYIANYLYYVLIKDKSKDKLVEKLLEKFYKELLFDCSSILTFNYDLLLEKYLFKKREWFPKDGYGFEIKELRELNPLYSQKTSRIKIFKMHGSLNWENAVSDLNFQLKWSDGNNYFFPGYLNDEPLNNFPNTDAIYSEGWFLPSWIKQFTYKEIISVWRQAFTSLKKAKKIIFIGYSLPDADSAVYSLLSTIDWNSKIVKIIDPNANELLSNYSLVLQKNNIETCSENLEKYLQKECT